MDNTIEEEVVDAIESTDEEEVAVEEEATEEEEGESVDELQAKLEEAEEAKRQLTARAKKAEKEAKALRSKPAKESSEAINNTLSADDVDVKILQSQGMSEDLIKELKAIAQVRGTSILATQLDPIFISIKEKKEQEDKNTAASLGASKGSGKVKARKSTATPNLSEEEHRNLWRDQRDK